MLDLVDPECLLHCIHTFLKPRGSVILTDPYDFRDEKGDPRYINDGKGIRKLLNNNGFVIDKDKCKESFLPWVLRINQRSYLVYFTDLVIARKSR